MAFVKVQMSGGKRLKAFADQESRRQGRMARVEVGYSKSYAIYVHEMLNLHHFTGQAKFLEQPFRQHLAEMEALVARMVKNHRSLQDALTAGGKFILEKSRPL